MYRVNKNINLGGGKSFAKNAPINEKDENFEMLKKAGHIEELAEAGSPPAAVEPAAANGESAGEEESGKRGGRRR